MKLSILLLAVLLIGGVGLVFAEPKDPKPPIPEPPLKRQILRVLRGERTEVLDPPATNSAGDVQVISLMYEGLVRPSQTQPLTWEPCLAEKWEADEKAKRWTFWLRKDVKFHDGESLTSHAVKATYERLTLADHPAKPRPSPYRMEYFRHIESIETPADHVVVFNLMRSDPRFLAKTGLHCVGIISPQFIKDIGDFSRSLRKKWFLWHSAGTGAFKLDTEGEEFDSDKILLTAFDEYWGGRPSCSGVELRYAHDAELRAMLLGSGDTDFVTLSDSVIWKKLQDNKSLRLRTRPGEGFCYLAMNCDSSKKFITADKRVREAIALAIDREAIIKAVGRAASPQFVLVPPVTRGHPSGYKPKLDKTLRDKALQKARELLKKAGAKEGTKLQLLLPDVPRPYLKKPMVVADLIRQQLGKIGLKVSPRPYSMESLAYALRKGEYPLVLLGWVGDRGEPADFWEPLLGSEAYPTRPSDMNAARFFDESVSRRIIEAAATVDSGERAKKFEKLERTVHDEFRPMVPLYTVKYAWAWRSEWKGIEIDAAGNWRFAKARRK